MIDKDGPNSKYWAASKTFVYDLPSSLTNLTPPVAVSSSVAIFTGRCCLLRQQQHRGGLWNASHGIQPQAYTSGMVSVDRFPIHQVPYTQAPHLGDDGHIQWVQFVLLQVDSERCGTPGSSIARGWVADSEVFDTDLCWHCIRTPRDLSGTPTGSVSPARMESSSLLSLAC